MRSILPSLRNSIQWVIPSLALLTCWAAPGLAQSNGGQPEFRTGLYRGNAVTYEVVGDKAIFEGDIILDHVQELPSRPAATKGPIAQAVGIAYPQYFWPNNSQGIAQIPYIITSAATNLNAAITQFNKTFNGVIQLVPRGSQTDYVNFDFDPNNHNGTCESSVGRVGGEQQTGGSIDCNLGTLLHELGHVVGLLHEQSRPDRNTFVTVSYANMIKGSKSNFDQLIDNYQDLGLYDYASVMHYIAFAFSRNGGPVLESIPAGIPLSNLVGYTAADIDGVQRLYGKTTKNVTVTTNPAGLSVIVDGATVKTPKVYSWTLNSSHTLNIPANAQTLSGATYTYGRWNDNTAASHTITVTPGNKTLAQPATSPAVTVYTANFIELAKFSGSVSPAGSGTLATTPAPVAYPGVGGVYYVERQSVTLTPTPATGYSFLDWGGTDGPWSSNPKQDYIPESTATYAPVANFSNQPLTTITTNPAGHWIYVDGEFWYGPQNFAFAPKSQHTISTVSPQLPYSINSRVTFTHWSDGGAETHTITIPTGASKYTATFTQQFVPIAYATPSCAANVTLSPTSTDGFYNRGTVVTIAAAPSTGWLLTGWLDDLKGTTAAQNLTVYDEELAVANYDTTSTALTVTSLAPAMLTTGGAGQTVTIKGTGFTASSIVFVNNTYRASSFVSSSQINVVLTSSDLATPGAFPIAVSNFPSGAPCSAYVPHTFFVTTQ